MTDLGGNGATSLAAADAVAAQRAAFDVVAIASSAGGLAALTKTLSGLPGDLPAAILVVQHLDPRHRSLMAEILSKRTALLVKQAEEGDVVVAGTVYVAPPDRHLLANADATLALTQSELVHFVRPSADLLFESVAASYRDRAIAVVLTGSGSDCAMGVRAKCALATFQKSSVVAEPLRFCSTKSFIIARNASALPLVGLLSRKCNIRRTRAPFS